MAKTTVQDSGLQELKNALKSGTFAPLYFLHGEEHYLQQHYLAQMKKKLVSGPMEEFNFRRLTQENLTMEALQDAVEAMPMMAEMTMVQVDDFDPFAQNEQTRDQLIEIFSDIPETCCLVFCYNTVKFSLNGKMKKMMDAVKKNGVVVDFQKQVGSALNDWISRHFRRGYEKTISPDLCQYLAFITDSDMTTLHSEIAKVAAYSRGEAISRQDIDAVVEPVLTAEIFDITDALSDGNFDKALSKLRDVLYTREDPIKILGSIGSHFRKLLTAHTVASEGKGADTLMGVIDNRSDYYARKLMTQARRIPEELCRFAVLQCYEADFKMKRSVEDGQRLLELLLLSFAQEARK